MKTLLQETLALRNRYDDEPVHSDHVTELALQIFDSLREPLKLEPRARELLHCGALLHDIGWSQTPNGRKHHKESARLIGEQTWECLGPHEIPVVAQIARYHRRSIPKPEHAAFQQLSAREQKQVYLLGGILRVADALDRSHTGQITRAVAEVGDEAVTVRVQPRGNWEAEETIFNAKREMLEIALGKPVNCAESLR